MKRISVLVIGLAVLLSIPCVAQSQQDIDAFKRIVPYNTLKDQVPGLTPQVYDQVVRQVVRQNQAKYLGKLSANPYDTDSVSNPYGRYGSQYSPDSVTNPYGSHGSRYSPNGAANPYSTGGPKIYGSDGKYLGKLNSNRYDPDSVSNPYGRYGSRYSPDSVRNPYGKYGSPYSPDSANNPYSLSPPSLLDDGSLLNPTPNYSLPSLWNDE